MHHCSVCLGELEKQWRPDLDSWPWVWVCSNCEAYAACYPGSHAIKEHSGDQATHDLRAAALDLFNRLHGDAANSFTKETAISYLEEMMGGCLEIHTMEKGQLKQLLELLTPEVPPVPMLADALLQRINEETERRNPDKHRNHLGGSIIGKRCERALFYHFRWAKKPKFTARMKDLFQRGHDEEPRIVNKLRNAGVAVSEYANDTKKEQYRVAAIDGHFGGSLDGIVWNVEGMPADERMLLEMKTYNEKQFKKLKANGVHITKPQHVDQMIIYMHLFGLKYSLYYAVCKNDDDKHIEIIEADERRAKALLDKAERIIRSQTPPERIYADSTQFECRYCDYKGICHSNEIPEPNCRTCSHSKPIENGDWHCYRHNGTIPKGELQNGCAYHRYLPGMLPWFVVNRIENEITYGTYVDPDGNVNVELGPYALNSRDLYENGWPV